MTIKELMKRYPEDFAEYAEKILDSYFGNISVFYRNEKVLYVNQRMAASVRMSKEEFGSLSLEEMRAKKLWLRSVSQEMYTQRRSPFNAYNVSKWGDELFTHVEPIFNKQGELLMSVQFSIPRAMLTEFSEYVSHEKSNFQNYKDIAEYLSARKQAEAEIICNSPAAHIAFQNAKYISAMDSTILICGETGTGKDVLANYIYRNSNRAGQPFVPVNCSAIPSELMESEFFGYDKGAFTGARSFGKPGLFEMANHGTLFLDEIGELPLPMQAKLLRVLETGEVMRVGGTKLIRTDVRVISATNRDLKQLVEEKRFREDLYYRLNVMPLQLPPLRDRKEDIVALARLFLTNNNRKYHLDRPLTPEMCRGLTEYRWPGNIRELRNVIERYAISGHLDVISAAPGEESEAPESGSAPAIQAGIPLHEACAQFEQAYIRQALEACGGSMTKTAKQLGIHRSLLYKKLKKNEPAGQDGQL